MSGRTGGALRGWAIRLLVVGGALASSACFSATQRREDTLLRQARTFNDDWRWARWDAMTTAMSRDDAATFRERVQAVEDELVLADFEVTSVTFATGSDTATVIARFEWYMKSDPRLRHTTVEQRWEHRNGDWRVVKLRRTRGDRFGLVTEPIASEAAGAASP